MRLYALAGRRGDALRQYEHLVRLLDEELGTEPGPTRSGCARRSERAGPTSRS